MRKQRRIFEIFLVLISLLIGFVISEIGLKYFTIYPITSESNKKDHPQLSYTLSPDLNDVDESGFRNTAHRIEESKVITIGDSHTYGENVAIEYNFPSILEKKTRRSVYNYGVSSYGIYQYMFLIEQASQFPIEDVVLAFYPANDLTKTCQISQLDYWKKRAIEEGFKIPVCTDSNIDHSISTSIFQRVFGKLQELAIYQIVRDPLKSYLGYDPFQLYFVDYNLYFMFDHNLHVSKDAVRRHSLQASLNNPEVKTNFLNSKIFLLDAEKLLSGLSIGFVVVIIPSKERTLHQWAESQGIATSEEFETLIKNELKLVQEYKKFFEDNNIAYSDALPLVSSALSTAIENGETFYKVLDGHPVERGYEAYADAAIEALAVAKSVSSDLTPPR